MSTSTTKSKPRRSLSGKKRSKSVIHVSILSSVRRNKKTEMIETTLLFLQTNYQQFQKSCRKAILMIAIYQLYHRIEKLSRIPILLQIQWIIKSTNASKGRSIYIPNQIFSCKNKYMWIFSENIENYFV